MTKRRLETLMAAGAAISVLLAGCGREGDAEETSAVSDAEAPYATPSEAPPAHAASPSRPETVAEPQPVASQEAIADTFDAAPQDRTKVSNITSATTQTKSAATQVAANGDDALKSPGGDSDAFLALQGDPARGKRLYGQCQACHTVVEGRNRVGPTLYRIVGRQAGAVEGFDYSPANAEADFVWTEDALFAFLEAPNDYLPGNRMIFPGIPKEQDRADIVAYLKTISE